MPVYGDMLAMFPELLEAYEVFKLEPKTGGGYGKRYDKRIVTGYWSWRKSARMGIQGEGRVKNDQAVLWVRDSGEAAINQGDYIEMKGDLFVVIDDDDFVVEGGYIKCVMQRVAPFTGQQRKDRGVNLGARDFS
jgi:hypothetical protein